jgi:signal transduction histidine kinase
LLEVCRTLTPNLEFEPLLKSLIEIASELTLSESSTILGYDEEAHFLRVLAAPFYLMKKLRNVAIPLDRSVAGMAFTTSKPIVLHHDDKDERILRIVDQEIGEKSISVLAVPMVFKSKVIGVLECRNKADDAHYTDEDVTILETLTAQAAVAIQYRHLLQEAQLSYEKALELDRMKSDFLGITSHELRTPLGLVIGHIALLKDTASLEQMEHIKIIQNSANRLAEITEELSDESSMKRGFMNLKRRKVGVQLLIQQVVDTLWDLSLQRNITISSEVPENEITVEGDAEKLSIALSNLIKNAIIFTNEGGKVKIKGEEVPGFIKISIVDNGIGIPDEELPKIFQRFYQVEKHLTRKHGGMGLGLAIAKEMVEMHGGRITVESVEGKGSRFMVFLPLNAGQQKAAERVFLI